MSPLPFAAIAAIRSVSNVFLLTITNISDSLCFVESSPDPLTKEATFFLQPASAAQRQYEALRAFFLDGFPSQDVAQRFGYTPGSFRVRVTTSAAANRTSSGI